MARAGRKLKAGPREPNGQRQRQSPTLTQLVALEQARRDVEKQVVLLQPHRLGDKRPERESAFGRFILRMTVKDDQDIKHRSAMQAAGDNYAKIMRRWRSAKGIKSCTGGDAPANGDEDLRTDEEINAAMREMASKITRAERAMSAASHDGMLYVRQLVLDQYDIGQDQEGHARSALWALALHYGMVKETRHPFN